MANVIKPIRRPAVKVRQIDCAGIFYPFVPMDRKNPGKDGCGAHR
jgi:hypothetical protein